MKIQFCDCYGNAYGVNVGDKFTGIPTECTSNIYTVENTDFKIIGKRLRGYNKSDGRPGLNWGLTCQTVFLIIDVETRDVLFTSKKYDLCKRREEDCAFYKELQDFINSGLVTDKGLFKIEDDVFEDI